MRHYTINNFTEYGVPYERAVSARRVLRKLQEKPAHDILRIGFRKASVTPDDNNIYH